MLKSTLSNIGTIIDNKVDLSGNGFVADSKQGSLGEKVDGSRVVSCDNALDGHNRRNSAVKIYGGGGEGGCKAPIWCL